MKEPIRAESQLLVGGTLTSTEDLDRSQRTCLAYWLKETYLNELCRGKATVQTAAAAAFGTPGRTPPGSAAGRR